MCLKLETKILILKNKFLQKKTT